MPAESRQKRPLHAVPRHAVRWRPRSNRQLWLQTVAIVVVMGIVAVVIPNTRYVLLPWTAAFICMRFFFTGSRRSRRSREALADRLAAMPRDDIPADVLSLVAAGKRIQAIKRYRDVAGVDLKEAKAVIDGL